MKTIAFILLCLVTLSANAQEDKSQNQQLALSGALDSNDAWEIELSYMKKLTSWFGLGAGLNLYRQYYGGIQVSGPPIHGESISEWILSDNSRRVGGVQFNPFIHFNTPSLFHIQDFKAKLYIEPGLQMTLTSNRLEADYWYNNGYYLSRTFKGHGGDWLSWNCRTGIALENEDFLLGLGYFLSNMDIYAYKRNIRIDNIRIGDYLPQKKMTWGLYIRLGIKF